RREADRLGRSRAEEARLDPGGRLPRPGAATPYGSGGLRRRRDAECAPRRDPHSLALIRDGTEPKLTSEPAQGGASGCRSLVRGNALRENTFTTDPLPDAMV